MKPFIVVGLFIAALWAVAYHFTIEASWTLLVGWITYLRRVLPEVRIYWPTVIVGCTAMAILLGGLHLFIASLRRTADAPEALTPRPWQLRWTAAMVALAIIAFAAGISLVGVVHQAAWLANSSEPALRESLPYGDRVPTATRLKEIYLGLSNAQSARGAYPRNEWTPRDGMPYQGWEAQILPYISVGAYDVDKTKPWNDPVNRKYFQCIIPFFINTDLGMPPLFDDEGFGLNHFAANSQVIRSDRYVKESEVAEKGASQTVLLGEVNDGFSPWGRPGNVRDPAAGLNRGLETFGGPRSRNGAMFGMADGSTRVITNDVDPEVLRQLSSPTADPPR